jgi:hypothetical protein
VGQVAQRQRHGVGGVDRPERRGDAEQCLHHALDLVLVGGARPGDRLLDLVGRVLDHLAAGADGLDHGHACRLGHRDGRAGVDLEQDPLDRHHRRPVLGQQGPHVGLQARQPLGYGQGGVGAEHAGGDGPRPPPGPLDHAVPAARQARVDAEHEHGFVT